MSRKLKLFAHYAPGWEDFLFLGTRGVLRDCGRARDRSELRWVALQQDFLGGFVILTELRTSSVSSSNLSHRYRGAQAGTGGRHGAMLPTQRAIVIIRSANKETGCAPGRRPAESVSH